MCMFHSLPCTVPWEFIPARMVHANTIELSTYQQISGIGKTNNLPSCKIWVEGCQILPSGQKFWPLSVYSRDSPTVSIQVVSLEFWLQLLGKIWIKRHKQVFDRTWSGHFQFKIQFEEEKDRAFFQRKSLPGLLNLLPVYSNLPSFYIAFINLSWKEALTEE